MSLWDRRFFGLVLATKVDLFLRDIQAIMKIYPGTSYWDAYWMPIPIRKWLIEEHVKQMEKEPTPPPQQNNRFQHPPNVPSPPTEKRSFTNSVRPTKK